MMKIDHLVTLSGTNVSIHNIEQNMSLKLKLYGDSVLRERARRISDFSESLV